MMKRCIAPNEYNFPTVNLLCIIEPTVKITRVNPAGSVANGMFTRAYRTHRCVILVCGISMHV